MHEVEVLDRDNNAGIFFPRLEQCMVARRLKFSQISYLKCA